MSFRCFPPFSRRSLARAALPALASVWLCSCGGSAEPAKGPAPAKVVWSRGDGEDSPAPDGAEGRSASSGAGDDDVQAGPNEIDLDALPAQSAAKPGRKSEPAPKEAPAVAAPEPPPPAPSPPSPPATEGADEPVAEEPAPAPAPPTPLGKEIRAAVKASAKDEPPPTRKPPKKAKPPPAESAAASYTGPNPCQTTHFSVPRVEEACANNGRLGAKTVMKEAIGKALASGATLKCADCHKDTSSYSLKKDAVAQLKKWLGP